MTEETVQVPESLIRNALDAIRSGRDPELWPDVVSDLTALLSQPTPTAEPDRRAPDGGLYAPPPPGGWPAVPRSIADMAPGTTEHPEGWPYSPEPHEAKRCGVAFVGYEDGDGSCEYLPGHPGRHWSAPWGSWSL